MNDLFIIFTYTFLITIFLFVFGITFIKRLHFGQYVRKLGPRSHYTKEGTPIFGGIIIVIAAILGFSLYYYNNYNNIENDFKLILVIFLPVFLYALLGFTDDLLKIKYKNNNGLTVKTKIIIQIFFALLYYLLSKDYLDTNVLILNFNINFKYFYIFLICLMFTSSTNAFNFCDGMDGLAAGLAIIILCGFLLIAIDKNNYNISFSIITFIAAILAFVCYNHKPAKIFMGDSGSMALGALLCNIAILLKLEFLFIVFSGVMIIETLSIIIQVIYYKLSKGKRIFLMAPIHHHFELKGIKEQLVVYIFWFLQLIFVSIAYLLYLKYY